MPHKKAITEIAEMIRQAPDTSGGIQLRRFLWSFYNMHHVVNLWTLVSRVGSEWAESISDVVVAALTGELNESDIKEGLVAAGEFSRWDNPQWSPEAVERLEEAAQALGSALLKLPPCPSQTEIYRLLTALEAEIVKMSGDGESSGADAGTLPGKDAVALMQEASQQLATILTKTPPCYEHTEVFRIVRSLQTLKNDLDRKM